MLDRGILGQMEQIPYQAIRWENIMTENTLLLSWGLRMKTGILFLLLYASIYIYNNEIIAPTSKDYVEKMYVHIFVSIYS